MAERYTRLYTLPENLYAADSPVLISAGVLLKDNQSGRVLAQLKFRSISDKTINAVKILVIGYDVSKEELCREEHQYLDLNVNRDNSFGAREAIPMPESSVRSYSVHVLAVFFSDGSRFFADEQTWLPLPEQQPLSIRLFDGELVKQYQLDTSKRSRFVPVEAGDLWLCSCGEVNHINEPCHCCLQELDTLKRLLNVELLREEKSERLRKEAQEAADAERFQDSTAKRLRLALFIFIPILLISAVAIFFSVRSHRTEDAYAAAQALLDSGNYSDAASAFEDLGDYMDSAEKAAYASASAKDIYAYEKAGKLLENGRYDDAYTTYVSLGNYRDSVLLAQESLYCKAHALIEEGEAEEAILLFEQLGDYKDSAEAASAFVYRCVREDCSDDEECGGPLSTLYTYDSSGRILTKTELYSAYPGRSDRVYEYCYADDGSYTVSENHVVQYYDSHGSYLGQGDLILFEYDYGESALGYQYCGGYSTEDGGFICETIYDEHGNRMTFTDTDGSVLNILNEYSDEGYLMKQEACASDGSIVERMSFEYDDRGLRTRMTYMDTAGTTYITEYTYALLYAPDL